MAASDLVYSEAERQLTQVGDLSPDQVSTLGAYLAGEGWTLDEILGFLESHFGAVDAVEPRALSQLLSGYRSTQSVRLWRSRERVTRDVLRTIALHQIDWDESGQFDLDRMLTDVMGIVAESVGCDACSIFFHDPYQRTLMLRATYGLNPQAVGRVVIRSDAGITGLAATSRETQVAAVSREHPAFLNYPNVGEEAYTSQVSVPMLLGDEERLIGVLNLQTRELHEFTPEEIKFIESVCRDLAIGVQSARLHSRNDAVLSMRVEELHLLQSVTRAVASTLQPDELLSMIVEHACNLSHGSSAILYRCKNQTSIEQLSWYPEDVANDYDVASSQLAMQVCTSRVATGIQPDAGRSTVLYGIPLVTRYATLGALVVRVDRRSAPSEEQLNLLQAYADSAALALENAELYDETRRGYATSSALLQEMHHRVRNNLQIVAALLSMQAREGHDAGWDRPLLEAVARVQSIASIHDLLSGDDLVRTTISAVARAVVDEASVTVVPPEKQIAFEVLPSDIELTSRQAMILALLINECITNAVVHGFASRDAGSVVIRSKQMDGIVELRIEDDGEGLPDHESDRRRKGLGTRIARTLAEADLGGSFLLESRDGGGTVAQVRFPAQRYSETA